MFNISIGGRRESSPVNRGRLLLAVNIIWTGIWKVGHGTGKYHPVCSMADIWWRRTRSPAAWLTREETRSAAFLAAWNGVSATPSFIRLETELLTQGNFFFNCTE